MTATNNLEESGTFAEHPFAELLVEIAQAKFSGALRVGHEKHKAVIYFRTGDLVYAATNSKSLRLFNLLLRKELIDAKTISAFPNFANDVEFGAALVAQGILERSVIDDTTVEQIVSILDEVLQWREGEWSFSPLVRIRDDVAYPIDLRSVLMEYGRCVGGEVLARFGGPSEKFGAAPALENPPALRVNEEFVLSSFGEDAMDVRQIAAASGLADAELLRALYVLWLGGFITRREWDFAFSAPRVGAILAAQVAKVKSAERVNVTPEQKEPEAAPPAETGPEAPPEAAKPAEASITLEEYLAQVEGAETHYDVLGIATDADVRSIKNAYFALAKQFHPDRYHREPPETLKRIQSAFTAVAHAHETLRSNDSRAAYDDKMRKELEAREKRRAAGQSETMSAADRQVEQALENFEEGIELLNEEEYEEAAKYLARAVHLSPQNALFQAYLGKALSGSGVQYRHKAEGAFNTAVRLDPKNSKIRLMLVEFLVEQKMVKRAEGELNRFLELVPNDKDAMAMLAKIRP